MKNQLLFLEQPLNHASFVVLFFTFFKALRKKNPIMHHENCKMHSTGAILYILENTWHDKSISGESQQKELVLRATHICSLTLNDTYSSWRIATSCPHTALEAGSRQIIPAVRIAIQTDQIPEKTYPDLRSTYVLLLYFRIIGRVPNQFRRIMLFDKF